MAINNIKKLSIVVCAGLAMTACENTTSNQKFNPIVLGDSATIVTETDAAFLKNNVDDLEYRSNLPTVGEAADKDARVSESASKQTVPKDTVSTQAAVATSRVQDGHKVAIGGGSSLIIGGVKLREFKNQDGIKESYLDYLITSGSYDKAIVSLDKGKIKRVAYRYKSGVNYTVSNKKISLSALSSDYSNWNNVALNGNQVAIPKVSDKNAPKVNYRTLRTAVQKELKARNYKSSEVNKAVKSIGSRTSVNSAPFSVHITEVTVKVTGTDAQGKAFEKYIKLEN